MVVLESVLVLFLYEALFARTTVFLTSKALMVMNYGAAFGSRCLCEVLTCTQVGIFKSVAALRLLQNTRTPEAQ